MSKVYFISDLHLGHKNILKFTDRGNCTIVDEHDEWLATMWNETVTKRDKIFVLGDVAFDRDKMAEMCKWNGTKVLVLGNHDRYQMPLYSRIFSKIMGVMSYKNLWLTHVPVHEDSIRGTHNVHGHTHSHKIEEIDGPYLHVGVDALNGKPISYDNLMEIGNRSGNENRRGW